MEAQQNITLPTIDEMLQWVDEAHSHLVAGDCETCVDSHYDGSMALIVEAIRAILEQHNQPMTNTPA